MKNKFFLYLTVLLLAFSITYGFLTNTSKPSNTNNVKEVNKIDNNNDENNTLTNVSKNALDDIDDEYLILVNKEYALTEEFQPEDLRIPKVKFPFEEDLEKKYLREVPSKALEEMFKAAETEAEIHLFAISGYRSFGSQEGIYNNKINTSSKEEADRLVSIPGHSEHQTGLTMDVSSESVHLALEESFADTAEGMWLKDNAHRFGYIIRYPKGKELITGYDFEPWHIRYVGVENATTMYNNNMTLEEYLNKLPVIEEESEDENPKNKK